MILKFFAIELDNPISVDLLIFISFLVMVSGRCLTFQIKDNFVNIINYKKTKKKLKLPVKKLLFQSEIDYLDSYDNPEICILTCNRYRQLKRCIDAYLSNLALFGHNNVNINVFDDSKIEVGKNVDLCSNRGINIFTLEDKYMYINNLIEKVSNYPEYIINSINYTFGNYNIDTSFGRNRNFISFLMKEKSYISLDDDSLPFVLTYKSEHVKEGLKNFIRKGEKNFKFFRLFLPKDREKILIPVDFYYKFKYSNKDDFQYVKYSGRNDMELLLMFFEQLGIDLNHGEILKYLNEPMPIIDRDTRFFMKEVRRGYDMRGLCIFYPKNTHDLRVTTSENYRIEDLILGVNYQLQSNKTPLEVNIALYHDKDLNFYINFEDIIKEFNGTTICNLYYSLVKDSINKLQNTDIVEYLFNLFKNFEVDFFDDKNTKELNCNRKRIINLFKNLSKDFLVLKSLIPKIEYFFSLFDINYINKEANRVIKNLVNSMFMWKKLKEINFK
ncbi:MAG: hypothetical protein KatS3mg068_1862 [Candidatus Sericytochromatia bacterium]|nr:MAG: hypothetical protein KatS3mg068_1862 [Candidatus Sericytochromatia bacterium]